MAAISLVLALQHMVRNPNSSDLTGEALNLNPDFCTKRQPAGKH